MCRMIRGIRHCTLRLDGVTKASWRCFWRTAPQLSSLTRPIRAHCTVHSTPGSEHYALHTTVRHYIHFCLVNLWNIWKRRWYLWRESSCMKVITISDRISYIITGHFINHHCSLLQISNPLIMWQQSNAKNHADTDWSNSRTGWKMWSHSLWWWHRCCC